jgi:hypothetical protein
MARWKCGPIFITECTGVPFELSAGEEKDAMNN